MVHVARAVTAVTTVLLLSGCLTERLVRLNLPVTRLEVPEATPRPVGAGIAYAPMVSVDLTEDQTTTDPDPQNPVLHDREERQSQHRFDWQVSEAIQVSARLWAEELIGPQLKWVTPLQPFGPGSHLAVTIAGAEADLDYTFSANPSQFSKTDIDLRMTDGAIVAGLSAGPGWMVFGGPFWTRHRYDGNYYSERGNDPDVRTTFRGDVTMVGANLGIASTASDWVRGLLELSYSNVEAGQRTDTVVMASGALQFHFGRRSRPLATPEETIEVVEPRDDID